MSYILDALKKSEAERNRGVAPSLLANRHVHLKSRVALWVLLAALFVNVCLGAYWLYSRGAVAPPLDKVVAAPAPQIQPEVPPVNIPAVTVSASPTPTAAPRPAALPRATTNEMELANLSFSTHVYASDPTKRAVTLNGRRLVEGDLISPGVQLEKITETGVVLEVNGREVPLDVLRDWH